MRSWRKTSCAAGARGKARMRTLIVAARWTVIAAALVGPSLAARPVAAQTATSTIKSGPRGNVTLTGQLSAADAQAILFKAVGLPLPAGSAALPWGDVNGDGKVSAIDAQIVLSYLVGLPTTGFTVGQPLARVATLSQPARLAVLLGTTQQLTASTVDSAGQSLTDRPISWTSSDTTVVKVSSTGLITPVKNGTASISVMAEGLTVTSFTIIGPVSGSHCADTTSTVHTAAI